MELGKKVKTALSETRLLILGSQILVGFQFRGVFQDAFDQLPHHAQSADIAALLLMLATVALLIAPSVYHRTIARGEDTREIHRVITGLASLALLPFALGLGIDLFIAIEHMAGFPAGLVAGAGFGLLALFAWYGFEFLRRSWVGRKERAMAAEQENPKQPTPLHAKIEQMLTEARIILPGVQALLGFQLAIIVTQGFDKLPESAKTLHGVSLGLLAVTVILLMAPAAYHRIVYAGEDAPEFLRTGGIMVAAATIPLALGLSADVYVVIAKITNSSAIGAVVAAVVALAFFAIWHGYPMLQRARTRRSVPAHGRAAAR